MVPSSPAPPCWMRRCYILSWWYSLAFSSIALLDGCCITWVCGSTLQPSPVSPCWMRRLYYILFQIIFAGALSSIALLDGCTLQPSPVSPCWMRRLLYYYIPWEHSPAFSSIPGAYPRPLAGAGSTLQPSPVSLAHIPHASAGGSKHRLSFRRVSPAASTRRLHFRKDLCHRHYNSWWYRLRLTYTVGVQVCLLQHYSVFRIYVPRAGSFVVPYTVFCTSVVFCPMLHGRPSTSDHSAYARARASCRRAVYCSTEKKFYVLGDIFWVVCYERGG